MISLLNAVQKVETYHHVQQTYEKITGSYNCSNLCSLTYAFYAYNRYNKI